MASFKASKVVSVLPEALTPDTLYLVRAGAGFDLYCSDATGSIAHKLNAGGSGGGASMGDVVMSASPTQYTAPDFLPLSGGAHSRSEYPALAELFPSVPFDAPTKLANPASPGASNHACLSPSGDYLAMAVHAAAPFLAIYKRSGDVFTRLPNPATLPSAKAFNLSWSPDNTYLAVTSGATPFVSFYKRSGDTFTKLGNPATLPGSMSGGPIAFSPDGTLVLSRSGSAASTQYLYARTGDTFTYAQAVTPAEAPVDLAWSPDGAYIAFVSGTNVELQKRSGNLLTRVALVTHPSAAVGVAWSSDGRLLYVAAKAAPYLSVYQCSGNSLSLLAGMVDVQPAAAPAWGGACATSPDGGYLAVGASTSPFLTIYRCNADGSLGWMGSPAETPGGSSGYLNFSQEGGYLAVWMSSVAPYVALYKGDISKFALPRMSLGVAAVKSYIKT